MKSLNILISAINLWIFGMFLDLFNSILSKLIKENPSLSKGYIVFLFKLYEHYIELWQRKEKQHLLLITKTL